MKEMISGVAILLVLLIFPLQSMTDTATAYKLDRINEIMFNAAEEARYDGYFSDPDKVKQDILSVLGDKAKDGDVVFEAEEDIKYRNTEDYASRERIEYKLTVTLRGVLGFLSYDSPRNTFVYVKEGFVYSEVLR